MGLEQIDTSNAQLAFQFTGGTPDQFLVIRYRGTEGLSQLYRFEIELASSEESVEFDKIVGKAGVLSINTEFGPRFFHGIISRFEMIGESPDFTHYRAELVPAVWMLTHRYHSRMFQETTVKEIITKVLDEAGIVSDRFDMSQLKREYKPREYCVQYRETDYNFICRLMEEEGIRWWFEHTKESSKLMLADTHSYVPIEGDFKLPYRPPSGMNIDEEHVFQFRMGQSVRLGGVVLEDFNFKNPGLNLESKADRGENTKLEFSDFPGEYTEQGAGVDIAKLRIEEFESGRISVVGQSNCARILVGRKFDLTEHPSETANLAYLITKVLHEGKESISFTTTGSGGSNGRIDRTATRATTDWVFHAGQVSRDVPTVAQVSGANPAEALTLPNLLDDTQRASTVDDRSGLYECRFECIPADVSYRPPRITPWPVVRGTQTARIVGPEGEEIHCDEFGRVKVQFHWDREGEFNDKSSCWIRVSQGMAGGGYGMMFLPRIGQEVIVDFLEGNPDKPIIIGRVYNADHMPPYPLPDQKTKSVIKGNSTPKGSGCNEIRFEDLKDKEQLFIQAQKQMDTRVKASHFHTTGGSYHLKVGGKDDKGNLCGELRELVYKATHVHNLGDVYTYTEKDESHTIDADISYEIGGNESRYVGGDLVETVNSNRVMEVTATAAFSAMAMKLEAKTGLELKCGGSSIILTPAAIFITAPLVNINSGSGPPVSAPVTEKAGWKLPEDASGADSSQPGKDVKYDKNGAIPQGDGPGDLPGILPAPPEEKPKEDKPDPTIEAKWSKSEVTPDHNSTWHPATPPTDTVPEEAKVQLLVTTTNVPDGTKAYLTINHCHTQAMIPEGSMRDLVVIGNKVVHKDTKLVPEWVFQQKHHPWDPWDKPFFYFRATLAYKGLHAHTPDDYEQQEAECLRVIYWHACVGDQVADDHPDPRRALTTVEEAHEIAGILGKVKKTKVLTQPFDEASAIPLNLWGSVLRNTYCYHHASHGDVVDRTSGDSLDDGHNPPTSAVGNNRSIIALSWGNPGRPGYSDYGDSEISQKNNVPSTPRYLAYIDTCLAGWEPSFANAMIRRGTQNVIAFRMVIPDAPARQMARDFHNKWTKNHKCDPDKIAAVFFDVGAAHYGSMRPVLFGKGAGAIQSPAMQALNAITNAISGAVDSILSLFN